MKKLIAFIIFLIVFLCQSAFADEIVKITSVNFDTSNAMIFLTSPDTNQEKAPTKINLVKLKEPNRAYFDINSAALTTPKQDLQFSDGPLKQLVVAQNSTNPHVVRVVMYFDDSYNTNKIKIFKLNNNYIVEFNDNKCKQHYFQNTFRDEHSSNDDFYEYTKVSSNVVKKIETPASTQTTVPAKEDKVIGEIKQAFNSSTATENTQPANNIQIESIKKETRLNTNFYLNNIYQNTQGVMINGFGSITLENPIYLTEPTRVVFDLPNTLVAPALRNKEYSINKTDSIKLGQFEVNKARVVITSPNVKKYIPIFSNDNQTLLIANNEKLNIEQIVSHSTNLTGTYVKNISSTVKEITFSFSHSLQHSVKRDDSKLIVYFLNASQFDEQGFLNSIKKSDFKNAKIELIEKTGLRLSLPLPEKSKVNTYLGSDGRAFKISITTPPSKSTTTGKGTVVLDPGHGGVDYGAIRAGVNEKDINLDVAQRVQAILNAQGYQTSMTRTVDETVSLEDRVTICEKHTPDIFVSIHVNSSVKPEITGVETHYYHDYSINLARVVHESLSAKVNSKDRGLFKSKFYVINHTTMPAILVEIGFISNAQERSELINETRKQQTAKAIAEGVIQYFKTEK